MTPGKPETSFHRPVEVDIALPLAGEREAFKSIIEIPVYNVVRTLLLIIVLLTLAYLAGQFSIYYLHHNTLLGFVPRFDLNGENNIPAWYSTVTILLCSILLGTIAVVKTKEKNPYAPHWRMLSVLFLLLSLDEAASIHEWSTMPWRRAFYTTGLLYYAWVIPGSIFALMIGVLYLGFLRNLPPDTRRLFVTAGVIYIGGVIGMEMVEGYYDTLYGTNNMSFALIVMIEEVLEMLGILVFLYALMSYLRLYVGGLEVRFKA